MGIINNAQAISDITTVMTAFLDQQIAAGLLVSYGGINIKVDEVDPRQVNVEFDAQVVVPLLFTHVSFAVTAS
ncbi:MAG: hypothetical protein DRJ03_28625 [Chloroflexi bacterium]|nr:MAG: hypothetical protein DRJ03_28625 [Chloroflexota bacterium]